MTNFSLKGMRQPLRKQSLFIRKKASGYNLTGVRTLAKGLLDAVRSFGIKRG